MTTPYFHGGDAFVSYPPLTNIHYELRVDIEIKPLSPNGLILFSGGNGAPVADFVSLSMAKGHVEFRYELGSGKRPALWHQPLQKSCSKWQSFFPRAGRWWLPPAISWGVALPLEASLLGKEAPAQPPLPPSSRHSHPPEHKAPRAGPVALNHGGAPEQGWIPAGGW